MDEIVRAFRVKYKENQSQLPEVEETEDDFEVEEESSTFVMPPPPYLHPAVKRVEIEGKERGMVATKRIKKGELIVHEIPFVSGEKNYLNTAKKALSSDAKRQKLSELGINYHIATELRHRCGDVPRDVRGISDSQWIEAVIKIASNCFMTPVNAELALFHYLSFFNHSCWPNATLDKDYQADSFCGTYSPSALSQSHPSTKLYALVDIPKNTEICFSYFPLTTDPENERERIFQKLGFRCKCGHCHSEQLKQLQSYKRIPTIGEIEKMIDGFNLFVKTSKDFFQLDNVTLMSNNENDNDLMSDEIQPSPSHMFLSKFRITDEDSNKIRLIRDIYHVSQEFELLSDFLSAEHWRMIEWRRKWALILMFLNRHDDALPVILDLIATYRNVLPPYHVQYQTAYKMLAEINSVVGPRSFSKDLLLAMKEASNITDFFEGGTHNNTYMKRKRDASWKSTLSSWNART
eukprot:TRINITY_DN6144_c0_g1_i1.p1 TRINITY_DN6144_c0_g1~~TRINITY_DN6144_c0_g1_i1.p1  ORF type:complete len:480 (-),score=103.63 TRINITY_DN6144_c0_g1_i1:75-1463(-)